MDEEQLSEFAHRWRDGFDTKDPKREACEDYVSFKNLEYMFHNYQDGELWEYFQDDFANWTEDLFKRCSNTFILKLHNTLQSQGVWSKKKSDSRRTTIAEALVSIINEETPTRWTEDDIRDYLETHKPFRSERLNKLSMNMNKGI